MVNNTNKLNSIKNITSLLMIGFLLLVVIPTQTSEAAEEEGCNRQVKMNTFC